jgi:hypothetical protein
MKFLLEMDCYNDARQKTRSVHHGTMESLANSFFCCYCAVYPDTDSFRADALIKKGTKTPISSQLEQAFVTSVEGQSSKNLFAWNSQAVKNGKQNLSVDSAASTRRKG